MMRIASSMTCSSDKRTINPSDWHATWLIKSNLCQTLLDNGFTVLIPGAAMHWNCFVLRSIRSKMEETCTVGAVAEDCKCETQKPNRCGSSSSPERYTDVILSTSSNFRALSNRYWLVLPLYSSRHYWSHARDINLQENDAGWRVTSPHENSSSDTSRTPLARTDRNHNNQPLKLRRSERVFLSTQLG